MDRVAQKKMMIHTTIDDLVAALTNSPFEICGDNRQADLLAGLPLEGILNRHPKWKKRRPFPAMCAFGKTAA